MADAQDVTLKGDKLNEILHPAAKISGVVIAGVVGGRAAVVVDGVPMLGAIIPRNWAGKDLCVDVLSADGLYESRNIFAVSSDWDGGVARIPYPTGYIAELSNYGPDEVGVLARPGDCSASGAPVTAAFWNDAPKERLSDEVRILLNSFRADEVYLFVGKELDAPVVTCRQLEGDLRTGFDMLCPIILPSEYDGSIEIEVNRVSGGALAEPFFLTLRTAP